MKRWPLLFRPLINLILATAITGLSTGILFLLRPYLSTSVVALLYLVPVVISATLLGRLAGIVSSVQSFLIFNFLFIAPYYTFQATHPQDLLAMIVFLGVSIFISNLMAIIQANLVQVQMQERDAVQLYELSVDLAGKQNQDTIAKTLAQRLAGLFDNTTIEVEVFQPGEIIRERITAGTDHPGVLDQALATTLPLTSPRGEIGQIRIWNAAQKISPDTERLLNTFASQGALALDRAYLSNSETRARVLEESDRLKTAILSSVSHELRTPLAAIQAAATSLFDQDVLLEAPARSELQSLVLEETEHMAQLVGNLLNMSRIEAKALKLQRQWNSFAEIVDTSLRRLRRQTSDHIIDVDVSEDLPLVSVDSVLMEQVIINLVSNSLKFSPPHSVIRITAHADNLLLNVMINNQGPAIPDEYISHIFEKFYPIPGRDPSRGTGLGLSICHGIIEAHGGKIWASNQPVGVAFHFTLPLTWDGQLPNLPGEEIEVS